MSIHKKRMAWICAAAVFVLLTGCPLPTPESPEGDEGNDVGQISEGSTLFEAVDGQPGVFKFETNDTAYEGGSGYTFWALSEGAQEPFRQRSTALTKFSGNNRAGYGIVFCHGTAPDGRETMLTAMINAAGEDSVGEVTGSRFSVLVPWTAGESLASGLNQRNILSVTLSGGIFTLRLNGTVAETFEDEAEPYHTGGANGYIVVISPLDDFPGTPVHVRFEEP